MTWLWTLLWIAVGIAVLSSFVAGAADEARWAQLIIRLACVRYAATVRSGVRDGVLLVLLAGLCTIAGALALTARVANAAHDAAEAGAARLTGVPMPDKEEDKG